MSCHGRPPAPFTTCEKCPGEVSGTHLRYWLESRNARPWHRLQETWCRLLGPVQARSASQAAARASVSSVIGTPMRACWRQEMRTSGVRACSTTMMSAIEPTMNRKRGDRK